VPLRLILVPHTHWDREWYFPYQRYRTRLVGFFDLLLDILDTDPDYRHFMLDGHAILIEDYLEVRPDRREKIERYVREGRLSAGPWYVIPDESLPSGEGLVRNLLRGHRVAKEVGSVMQVGYLPDPFGQIAHMPAILNGFGIRRCVFWRGTDASLKTTEFVWEAADGSEVIVRHMIGGYGIASPFPTDDHDAFLQRIEDLRRMLEPLAQTRTLLIMWGSDHVPPQRGLSSAIRSANARLADAEIVHGSLPQLFDEIESKTDGGRSLPRRRGEFRSGQLSNVLPGVLSARVWIKQRTYDCENLLTRWAEPLTAWSGLLRRRSGESWSEPPPSSGPASPHPHEMPSEAGLLDRAWRLLLENQPHDSICGCSIDQTHDEMRPRFDQCWQIGDDLAYEAMRRIGAQGPAERVFVFNPLSGPRTDVAMAVVPAKRGGEPVALVDERGRRSPCQRIASADPRPGRVTVAFVASDVPGFGYRTYRMEYGAPAKRRPRAPRIENEFFRVAVNARDGTLTVTDKRDGRTYRGLNRLVDGGDKGDEYNYDATEPDPLVSAPAAPPKVRLLEDGAARQTLEVRMTYRLPAGLDARRRRSARMVSCPVRVLVGVYPGVPRIDVRTEIDNRAEDHRLRAHFPTGIASDVSHAEQHFGVVTRPIALPPHDASWQEQPVGYHPQKVFADVNDGERGLMIANRGLQEYEALDTRGGVTIALTLLRCVGWLSRADL
jgi:alpha-mannosidase